MTRPLADSPSISVLLPTTSRWPAIEASLASLLAQADAPPFEILVLDGSGDALAEPPASGCVRWLRLPGHDSFALRAAGIAAARGAIVAITEDHCIAPPDWVRSIAIAQEDSDAPVVVGAVVNHADSSASAIDRANFLLTFAGQTPKRMTLQSGRLPVPTNVSIRRAALGALAEVPGSLEYRFLAECVAAGAVRADDRIVLAHRQRWGRSTWAVHAASGRSYGGAVHAAPLRARLRWWLRLPLVPLRLATLVWREARAGAAGQPATTADFACLGSLILANLAGQVTGALLGAGASRRRL